MAFEAQIKQTASLISIAWISPERIDEIGLTDAMHEACQFVFSEICSHKVDSILIDGNVNYLKSDSRSTTVVGGDDIVPSIMAASIIAKEARDLFMAKQHRNFPEFGFESNVGYGTKAHMEALATYGVTDIHRKSYKPIKTYLTDVGEYRNN